MASPVSKNRKLRKELEEELALRRHLLEIGDRLGAASASASSDIFPLLSERLASVVPIKSLTIFMADQDTRRIHAVYHSEPEVEERIVAFDFPIGEGATGHAVEIGENVIANEQYGSGSAKYIPGTPRIPEHLLVVPVKVEEEVKVALTLRRNATDPPFLPQDARRAELFGQHVGSAFLLRELAEKRALLAGQVEQLEGLNRLKDGILADIAQVLVTEGSPEHILETVADGLRQLVPYDTVSIFTADVPHRLLQPTLVRDQYAEEILAMGAIPFGTGITGTVAETGEPALVQDVTADARSEHIPGTPDEPEALIAVPLVARSELKGVLCLYRLGAGNVFSENDFSLAIRFGNLAALAIDNADIRARLRTQVVTDHLTGLRNHRFFHERLEEEVVRTMRQHSNMALLVFDIDDFKWVNDAYGHLVGDRVLQELAVACRAVGRGEDLVCRIGGEEFAVILPGQTAAQAAVLGERLLEAARALPLPEDIRITVSAGLAETPRHATGPRDLFACADAALLAGKATGKDRLIIYGSDEFAEARMSEEQDIVRAAPGRSSTTGSRRRWKLQPADLHLHEVRSLAQMRMLHKLASRLTRLNDEAAIGEAITAELRGLIDYHNCRVYVLDEPSEMLIPVAFRGELSEYQGETFDALLTRVGEGVTGRAVERRETIYVPDAAHCDFADQIVGTPEIDETILAVPLLYGERATGVIVLSRLGINQFDEHERRLLEVLAFNAATAFENARLITGEREAARTLEMAYLSTVEALANALEAQDTHTHHHARALAEMALAVGRELGLDGDPLRTLELAALFHDIGKIGVPSEVIRKPGPLTEEEWTEMMRHPEIGAQIIAPVPYLQPVVPIVRACHEHWDGSGYPMGLRGDEIPLEARIILVCDAFHAMTSDRPYRRAMPFGSAVSRLRQAEGSQFDPVVVDTFVRLARGGRIETNHSPVNA